MGWQADRLKAGRATLPALHAPAPPQRKLGCGWRPAVWQAHLLCILVSAQGDVEGRGETPHDQHHEVEVCKPHKLEHRAG